MTPAPGKSATAKPHQTHVAAVLQQAARWRTDVRQVRITAATDAPMLLVDLQLESGVRIRREASLARVLDGRTVQQILNDWIGVEASWQPAASLDVLDKKPADLVKRWRAGEVIAPGAQRVPLSVPSPRKPQGGFI